MSLKDETLRHENIELSGGKYRYVNHKARISTEEYTPRNRSATLGQQSKLTTQRELQLKYWGPLHDLVAEYNDEHKTDIKPWSCVQSEPPPPPSVKFTHHPDFSCPPGDYKIAVAILWNDETKQHTPVFVGDPIYIKDSPFPVDWSSYKNWTAHASALSRNWAWVPQEYKREFEINGQKFTCPDKELECDVVYHCLDFNGRRFMFHTKDDRDRVRNSVDNLLMNAREQ